MRGSAPPSTSPPSCGEVFITSYNRAARKTDVIREDTYAGNRRARAEAAHSPPRVVLRRRHPAGLADHPFRGGLESARARLGQGHARAVGLYPPVHGAGLRSGVAVVLGGVDHRVRRWHRAHPRPVHALLRRRGGGGDADHHLALLEGGIFLAQSRLRVHAAVGPRLLRYCAARRRALLARPQARRAALIESMIPKSVQRFSGKIMLKQEARAG